MQCDVSIKVSLCISTSPLSIHLHEKVVQPAKIMFWRTQLQKKSVKHI